GYQAESGTLLAGRTEVRFVPVPPVTVRVPGMRQLVGTEQVWIALELLEHETVATLDSRSRRMAQTLQRAASSYGALNENDVAVIRPLRDGRYRVLAMIGDKRRGGLVNVTFGEVQVRIDATGTATVLTVAIDTQGVLAAMQQVASRRAAEAASSAGPRRRGK